MSQILSIENGTRDPVKGTCDAVNGACETVKLNFEARCKSRLLLRLDSGETAALIVERGRLLRGGDRVRTEDGRVVQIIAVEEALLEASSDDPVTIAKAAYHLGNRHVAVQVMPNRLRFLDDHVLGEMVKGLGLRVTAVLAAFEPEGGAYGHHHAHGSQMPLARPKIHEFPPA
jgi:urease accessory protein